MQPRRLLFFVATLASIFCVILAGPGNGTWNPLEQLVSYAYRAVTSVQSSLSSMAISSYKRRVTEYLGRLQAPSKVEDAIKNALERLDEIKIDRSSLVNKASELKDFLDEAGGDYIDMAKEKIESLRKIASVIGSDNDGALTRARINELCQDLTDELVEKTYENINKDTNNCGVSFLDKVKYYLLKFANRLVYVLACSLKQILKHITAATLLSLVVCYAAIHISIRFGLAFFRVLVWIIKLPFRVLRAVVRFIFKQDKKLELDASMGALLAECSAGKPTERVAIGTKAQPQSSAGLSRRLAESNDDAYASDMLVEDELDDDFAEDLAEEEPFESLLAEKPQETLPISGSKIRPVVAPSSAAAIGSVAAFVAVAALFI